ncbi:MAG: cytochrome P450 [Anaerolineae bacterium]
MDFNPLSPEFQSNPYVYYGFLRQNMPVFFFERWGIHFIFRYADCSALLRDGRLGHELRSILTPEESATIPRFTPPEQQRALYDIQSDWMLMRDNPFHGRIRGLVHRAFTPRTVEQLRGKVEKLALDLIRRGKESREFDVVRDLAYPLPVKVIAELLGVPVSEQDRFTTWSQALVHSFELTEEAAVYDRASAAAAEMREYMRGLLNARRAAPQNDLISALAMVEEGGDKLTEHELLSTVILLLVAGHETTVNLIGSGTLAFIQHPHQYAKLRANPELARNAVEECLRYDSPVQLTQRRIQAEGVTASGVTLPRLALIVLMLGAANRDPQKFANPNVFDIERPDAGQHLAFGSGAHYCLGAPLARLEGEIVFRTMARELPNLDAVSSAPPRYKPTFVLRGLQALTISW